MIRVGVLNIFPTPHAPQIRKIQSLRTEQKGYPLPIVVSLQVSNLFHTLILSQEYQEMIVEVGAAEPLVAAPNSLWRPATVEEELELELESMSVISSAEDGPDEVKPRELVGEQRIIESPFRVMRDWDVPLGYYFAKLMELGPWMRTHKEGLLLRIAPPQEDGGSSYYPIHIEYLVTRVTAFVHLLDDKLFEGTVVPMPPLPHPEFGSVVLDWCYTNKITKGESDPSGEKILECIKHLGVRVDGLLLLDRLRLHQNSVQEPNATFSSIIQDLHNGMNDLQVFLSSGEPKINVIFTFYECARIGKEICNGLLSSPTKSEEVETLTLSYERIRSSLENIMLHC